MEVYAQKQTTAEKIAVVNGLFKKEKERRLL
jgi:hypothetical protein